jgi:hypothetical protein
MADPPRKPGETLERFADRLIREAQEQGEFDRLSGKGKPLPLTGALEEAWWIKEKLRREKLSDLPEALAIRLEVEQVLGAVERADDEQVVRERLEALNARIRKLNRSHVAGPPTTLAPFDVDAAVSRWRRARGGGGDASGSGPRGDR